MYLFIYLILQIFPHHKKISFFSKAKGWLKKKKKNSPFKINGGNQMALTLKCEMGEGRVDLGAQILGLSVSGAS